MRGTYVAAGVFGGVVGFLLALLQIEHEKVKRLEREVMQVRMELAISHFKDNASTDASATNVTNRDMLLLLYL